MIKGEWEAVVLLDEHGCDSVVFFYTPPEIEEHKMALLSGNEKGLFSLDLTDEEQAIMLQMLRVPGAKRVLERVALAGWVGHAYKDAGKEPL